MDRVEIENAEYFEIDAKLWLLIRVREEKSTKFILVASFGYFYQR